jgi:DNA-binding beta-propeller fold protein YncE
VIRKRFLPFALVLGACVPIGCRPGADPGTMPPLFLFGRTGMGPLEFNYPRAAAISPAGDLYVVDKAGRIQAITQAGEFVLDWRMPEIDAGKPTGIGIAPDGTVYAADTHYARVLVFAPEGKRLGQFGSLGDGPGQFHLPTDVAIDRAGFLYVSEYGGNDRISKFTPQREYLFSFGGRETGVASMQRPQALLIGPDDTLWVADSCNHRVCHFDGDGQFLGSFGRPGHEIGQLWFPYGLDMLSDGTLVVCEYGNNRVQRFDTTGHSLGIWGAAGRRPGQLAYPWALAVGDDDRIFVIDSGNNRVQVIDGASGRTWYQPSRNAHVSTISPRLRVPSESIAVVGADPVAY